MKLFSTVILTLFAIGTASAAMQSSNVSLGGGTIGHGQTFTLLTDKLAVNVDYTVTCNLTDPNNAQNQAIVYFLNPRLYAPTAGDIKLNGVSIGNPTQIKLPQVANKVEFDLVTYMVQLGPTMTNADQTDDVVLSSCIAVANG